MQEKIDVHNYFESDIKGKSIMVSTFVGGEDLKEIRYEDPKTKKLIENPEMMKIFESEGNFFKKYFDTLPIDNIAEITKETGCTVGILYTGQETHDSFIKIFRPGIKGYEVRRGVI